MMPIRCNKREVGRTAARSAKMDVSELIIQFNGILHDLNLRKYRRSEDDLKLISKIAELKEESA
jgi:hypothetical protein